MRQVGTPHLTEAIQAVSILSADAQCLRSLASETRVQADALVQQARDSRRKARLVRSKCQDRKTWFSGSRNAFPLKNERSR